jgi:hypothetical protein
MKKILVALVIMALFSSCAVEFGAKLGGYKAPRRRVCVVGRSGSTWNY